MILAFVALLSALGIVGLGRPSEALAWKPGGHYVLAQKVQNDMEPGVIKSAMGDPANVSMAYAWGAYGADVGYGTLASAFGGWASYADLFHYQKAGSFAKALLQNAIASKHSDQIAYAAGWLTHVCGDMYVHQDLVNPHAGGVFFDKEGTIPLHRDIESWADTVMWEDYYGNHSGSEFNASSFGARYHRDMPLGLCSTFAATVKQVYQVSPSSSQAGALIGGLTHSDSTLDGDDFETLTEKVYLVLSTGWMANEAGLYKDRGESEAHLASLGITDAEILAAADKGAAMATWLLDCAQRGDYSAFSDTWNLDVGPGSPDALNSLVVEVTTSDSLGAGTNADVDFWIADKTPNNPNGVQFRIDHAGYDDFERNDRDLYFCYTNPNAPAAGIRSPNQVGHIGLYCRGGGVGPAWDPRRVKVWCNGVLVVPNAENIYELNGGSHNWWIYPAKTASASSLLNWSPAIMWPSRPVPNVTGMTVQQAKTTLSAATYYSVGTVTDVDSVQPVGTIVSQTPGAYARPGFGATVNISVSRGAPPEMRGLTYLAGAGGTIAGTAFQTVAVGGTGSPVTAVASAGYHFVSWSDGRTSAARTDVALANTTLTATFAPNTLATSISLAGASSVYRYHYYRISGTVAPSAAPGRAKIVFKRYYSGAYRQVGSTKYATVTGGAFAYRYKPSTRGSWRVYVTYLGNSSGAPVYRASSTKYKSFKVK